MIFSAQKWNNAAEITPFISVARSTKFSSVEGPLRSAFDKFIRSLIGESLTAKLIEIYGKDETNRSADEKRLLELAQASNAWLAYWYSYDEMQVLIGEAGIKRQESETEKTPFKYQEQQIKSGWKEKGFNSLDDLLAYLEFKQEVFTDFKTSSCYTDSKKEIVRSASEINEYYSINSSRIIYLRLKPHFKTVCKTIIEARIGSTLYAELIASISGTSPNEKHTTLREKLIPVIVFYALNRLIKETGSITDRGLYFESLPGNSDDIAKTSPVSDERLIMQANMMEADAISYWLIAERYLKSEFSYTGSNGTKIPRRDNTDKNSFWA